jgi:hypothetical protein
VPHHIMTSGRPTTTRNPTLARRKGTLATSGMTALSVFRQATIEHCCSFAKGDVFSTDRALSGQALHATGSRQHGMGSRHQCKRSRCRIKRAEIAAGADGRNHFPFQGGAPVCSGGPSATGVEFTASTCGPSTTKGAASIRLSRSRRSMGLEM